MSSFLITSQRYPCKRTCGKTALMITRESWVRNVFSGVTLFSLWEKKQLFECCKTKCTC